MHFLIQNFDLFKNRNTVWGKVSPDIKKEFNSERVYNKTFWKIKKKFLVIKLQNLMRKKFLGWNVIILV